MKTTFDKLLRQFLSRLKSIEIVDPQSIFVLTDWDQNFQLQGPHPKEICNCIQQLCLDARIAWQTTYVIRKNNRDQITSRSLCDDTNQHTFSYAEYQNQNRNTQLPFWLIHCRHMYGPFTPCEIIPVIHNTIIMEKHNHKIL